MENPSSYGIVYKARYHDETVVVKNIMGELTEDENNFVKEAKLLRSLQHKNIVAFKNFVIHLTPSCWNMFISTFCLSKFQNN